MSKKIAILQSNYIPWIGYFDIINKLIFSFSMMMFNILKTTGEIEIKSKLIMDYNG